MRNKLPVAYFPPIHLLACLVASSLARLQASSLLSIFFLITRGYRKTMNAWGLGILLVND